VGIAKLKGGDTRLFVVQTVSIKSLNEIFTNRRFLNTEEAEKIGIERDLRTRYCVCSKSSHCHRPSVLESVYQTCLLHELLEAALTVHAQVALPVEYDGLRLDSGYRLDLLIENTVIVELKCVEALLPIHKAQLLTYLRLANTPRIAAEFQCCALEGRNQKSIEQ
jgi:GxxExxY protein